MTEPERDAADLHLRACAPGDLDSLARLNRELIEDEGHRNPMSIPELRERFQRFLSVDGWTVEVFLLGSEIAGFATYRHERNDSDPHRRHVHLRQFYVSRSKRRLGLGAKAVRLLMEQRFSAGDRVFLEALETNPGGRQFWSRVGFIPYSTIMEQFVRPPSSGAAP